jgi:nitric oxide reductase NorQ protein
MKDLKQSTKQRFTALDFDYPAPDVETGIVAREAGIAPDMAEKLVEIAGRARALKGHGLDEGISTRLIVYAGQLIAAGVEPKAAAAMAMVRPVTDDEDIRETLLHAVDMVLG